MNFSAIDPSWRPLIETALKEVANDYWHYLNTNTEWLPGPTQIFNAFSLPLEKTQYILFGESPYPRAASAIGYAFWDGAVDSLWSDTGFSKTVNRATSLRNMLKMLLLADDLLDESDLTQMAIAKLNKQHLVTSIDEFFNNFLNHGFLLLNASLVLSTEKVSYDAKHWLPFVASLLKQLSTLEKKPTLILFGSIAKIITTLDNTDKFPQLISEHPYNISFIYNRNIRRFFKPLKLLHHEPKYEHQ